MYIIFLISWLIFKNTNIFLTLIYELHILLFCIVCEIYMSIHIHAMYVFFSLFMHSVHVMFTSRFWVVRLHMFQLPALMCCISHRRRNWGGGLSSPPPTLNLLPMPQHLSHCLTTVCLTKQYMNCLREVLERNK